MSTYYAQDQKKLQDLLLKERESMYGVQAKSKEIQ